MYGIVRLIKLLVTELGLGPKIGVAGKKYCGETTTFNEDVMIAGSIAIGGSTLSWDDMFSFGNLWMVKTPYDEQGVPPNIFGTGGIITGWSGIFITGIEETLGFTLTSGTSTVFGAADISYAALGDYANALKSEILPETFTITPDDTKNAFNGDLIGGWKYNGVPLSAVPELSDIRLKKNIELFKNGLDIVLELNPVRFDWNEDVCPTTFLKNYQEPDDQYGYPGKIKRQYGLIAQEVEQIAPDVVNETTMYNETYKLIQYEKIVPILISAVQDQQKQIEELRNEISLLKGNNK